MLFIKQKYLHGIIFWQVTAIESDAKQHLFTGGKQHAFIPCEDVSKIEGLENECDLHSAMMRRDGFDITIIIEEGNIRALFEYSQAHRHVSIIKD